MSDAHGLKGELDWLEQSKYDNPYRCPAIARCSCPQCGSGEVWQPMQTLDMPMMLECLRCGEWTARGDCQNA